MMEKDFNTYADNIPQRDVMRSLVQKAHAHQSRNNGKTPYWEHCYSVADILDNAIKQAGEVIASSDLATDLHLAALGHDLYEDTQVTPEEITHIFNSRVDTLIGYLTNDVSDLDREAYHQKIHNAPEEAKLIKMADLIENTTSVTNNLENLGLKWAQEFFLPIISEMKQVLDQSTFVRFPDTAHLLAGELQERYTSLLGVIEMVCVSEMNSMNTYSNDETRALMKKISIAHARTQQDKLTKLNAIKKDLQGKERFDIEEFAKLYRFCDQDSKQDIQIFEIKYYLDYPDIKTIKEFADHLNYLDAYDVN